MRRGDEGKGKSTVFIFANNRAYSSRISCSSGERALGGAW